MPKPFSNGFKPRNSLGQSSPYAPKATYGGRKRASTQSETYAGLHLKSVVGDNVQSSRGYGEEASPGTSNKRRKIVEDMNRAGASGVTDDDWFDRKVEIGPNTLHRRPSDITATSNHSKNFDRTFGLPVRDLDRLLNANRKRPRRSGNHEPVRSSRMETETVVLDDDVAEVQEISRSRSSPVGHGRQLPSSGRDSTRARSASNQGGQPKMGSKIQIPPGVQSPDVKRTSKYFPSSSVETRNAFESMRKTKPSAVSSPTPREVVSVIIPSPRRRKRSNSSDHWRPDFTELDSGHEDNFPKKPTNSLVHNDIAATHTTARVTADPVSQERRQQSPKSPEIWVPSLHQGSEDELDGPTTVVSSPKKQNTARTKPRLSPTVIIGDHEAESMHVKAPRHASPSDIRPTQFAKPLSRQRASSGQKRKAEDRTTLKAQEVFTGYIDTQNEDIEISIDLNNRFFAIYIEGEVYVDTRLEKPARFTALIARQCKFSSRASEVYLTGAKNSVSHGKMIFKFDDSKTAQYFVDLLEAMWGPDMQIDRVTVDTLRKIVQKAKEELQKISVPPPKTSANKEDLELVHMQRRQDAKLNAKPPWEQHDMAQVDRPKREARNSISERLADRTFGNTQSLKQSVTASEPGSAIAQPTRSSQRLQAMPDPSLNAAKDMEDALGWSRLNTLSTWECPMVYPTNGDRRTTVQRDDIARLDDGEFLNDSLVDYSLRKLEEEHPELKSTVHFFNSFFYNSLSTFNGRKKFNYDGVKRWTKKIDLFSFPFVIVPICVNYHWFVAIICNLPSMFDPVEVDDDPQQNSDEQDQATSSVVLDASAREAEKSEVPASDFDKMSLDPIQDGALGPDGLPNRDEITDSEGERVARNAAFASDVPSEKANRTGALPAVKGRKGKKKFVPPLRKQDPRAPIVITLDSLGSTHVPEIKNLKDYILAEGKDKRDRDIPRDQISGITAKGIPEQTNFADCGVYVIAYVEEFLKNPRQFVNKVCSRELDRSNDFAGFDPSEKRASIRDEILCLADGQNEAFRAKRRRKNAAKRKVDDNAAVSSDDTLKPAKAPKLETGGIPLTDQNGNSSPIKEPEASPREQMLQSASAEVSDRSPGCDKLYATKPASSEQEVALSNDSTHDEQAIKEDEPSDAGVQHNVGSVLQGLLSGISAAALGHTADEGEEYTPERGQSASSGDQDIARSMDEKHDEPDADSDNDAPEEESTSQHRQLFETAIGSPKTDRVFLTVD